MKIESYRSDLYKINTKFSLLFSLSTSYRGHQVCAESRMYVIFRLSCLCQLFALKYEVRTLGSLLFNSVSSLIVKLFSSGTLTKENELKFPSVMRSSLLLG